MDMNGQIAALLRDFAAIQKSKQSMWGYKRAASAILALEQPIESLLNAGRHAAEDPEHRPLVDAHHPRGAEHRDSPTIERAIAESGQAADVERRRGLRDHFLSRAQVLARLAQPRS